MENLSKYRKALVAAAGMVAIFIPEAAGLDGNVAAIYDAVVGILTAFGVFQVRNEPEPPVPPAPLV